MRLRGDGGPAPLQGPSRPGCDAGPYKGRCGPSALHLRRGVVEGRHGAQRRGLLPGRGGELDTDRDAELVEARAHGAGGETGQILGNRVGHDELAKVDLLPEMRHRLLADPAGRAAADRGQQHVGVVEETRERGADALTLGGCSQVVGDRHPVGRLESPADVGGVRIGPGRIEAALMCVKRASARCVTTKVS